MNMMGSLLLSFTMFAWFLAGCVDPILASVHRRHGDDIEVCDDGKKGIQMDLHGESDWKCEEEKPWDVDTSGNATTECYPYERAYHVCINKPIDNLYASNIPHSGPHRKVWAQYGEYNYVPPGRYVHNLEHGGVVFMYHPCAPTEMVLKLRKVATTCLYRYLMTAFTNLTREYPFAVLTYGCIYRMSSVNIRAVREWVRMMSGKSPEDDVYGNGDYVHGLLVPSIERDHDRSKFCVDLPDDVDPFDPESLSWMDEPKIDVSTSVDIVALMTKPDVVIEQNEPSLSDMTTEAEQVVVATGETTDNTEDVEPNTIAIAEFATQDNQTVGQNNQSQFNVTNYDEDLAISDSLQTLWALGAMLFLVLGTFTGLCLMKVCGRSKDLKSIRSRIWSDNKSNDSFSVAAIVRKLPKSILKTKKPNSNLYQRIEKMENSSDEEII